jgi:hypothetical protein
MRKPSKKTWLVLAGLVAGGIVAAFVLPVIFSGGNDLVNYANYLDLQKQRKAQKQMAVDEVEAFIGPAARTYSDPNRTKWYGMRETRFYVGRRDRGNRRDLVRVEFVQGNMWGPAVYECVYDPPWFTRIAEKLEERFWALWP